MNLYDSNFLKKILPDSLHITSTNGNYELKKSDCTVSPPQIHISYHHFTPKYTDDVLTDGEPDYVGIDLQFITEPKKLKCDITYGDAMMYSFDIFNNGEVKVGTYNGYKSKFDPEYEFFFQEDSIISLIEFFEKISKIKLNRRNFNFLDGDKNSFKMEKVNHRKIVDFKSFNPLGLL
jgi:hypothetical protein